MESIHEIMARAAARAQAEASKINQSSVSQASMPKGIAELLAKNRATPSQPSRVPMPTNLPVQQQSLSGGALSIRQRLTQQSEEARLRFEQEKAEKERRAAEWRSQENERARLAEEQRIKDERLRAAMRPAHVGPLPAESVEAALREGEQKWDTHEEKYDGDGKKTPIIWTPACQRIYDLEEWDWTKDSRIAELVHTLTARYKLSQGTMTLRPVQAALLFALQQWGTAFGAIGVGEGKTLISFLAPTVLQVKRAVLLIPAKLVGKTEHDFKDLAKHWPTPERLEVISYQKISHKKHAKLLWDEEPELIIADEAHALANDRAACTRRVRDFLEDYRNTAFVPMSGTMVNRSILNFAHLMLWALGSRRTPLPENPMELSKWARAIDEKVKKPIWVGDLVRFVPVEKRAELTQRVMAAKDGAPVDHQQIKDDTVQAVRDAIGDRINKTRGVIYTRKRSVEASIYIDLFDAKLSDKLLERLNALQEERQGIMELSEKKRLPFLSKIWQKARQLCCGFNYVWDPEPPDEWKDARSKWRAFVLDILKQDLRGLEAASQVKRQAKLGMLGQGSKELCERWERIKPTFTLNIVPEWIDKAPLYAVADRVKEPTLIWTEFQAVGYALSEIMGFPFFHRDGKDQKGNAIEKADPKQSLILSIASNAEGRNLQAWNRNLILTPMGTGKVWEQLLGRTHRSGQQADEIYVDIMMGCRELEESLDQALRDADFNQRMSKNPQKLLLADFINSKSKEK